MFVKKILALGLLAVTLLLLPINNVHARLSSEKWQNNNEPSTADTAQIVLQIQSSSNNEVPPNDSMTVTSDSNPNNFFHEDYVYTFHPTASSSEQQQWQIQRIPNPNRKLQSSSSVEGTSININTDTTDNAEEEEESGKNMTKNITNALLSLACVILAALAAGLTMGMLSLDPLSLEIKRRASTIPEEQQWSADLLPLLVGHSKRHRLLCSLLVMNSIANEALPLFLDELFPSKYASIIVSVTLVLFFGEIVPSAFFTGPNQVEVAAKLVPLVKAVMFVLAPIAVPIAKVLDRVLHDGSSSGGHGSSSDVDQDVTEGNYYNRTELSALVRIQYESQLFDKRRRKQAQAILLKKSGLGVTTGGVVGVVGGPSIEGISSHVSSHNNSSESGGSVRNSNYSHHSIRSISRELTASHRPIDDMSPQRMPSIHLDEITMIEGALTMTTKVAADVYTPLRSVYALPSDTILDEHQMVEIWARGFSRVPVYSPNPNAASSFDASSDFIDTSGVVGVLMVRQLIVVNSAENRPINTLPLAVPSCISPSMHLVDLINLFQVGGGRGRGGLHLALVCARPRLATEALERGESIPKEAGVIGIITLEDVIEELLQEEIYDEADRYLELTRWGVNKWKRFVSRKKLRRLQQEQKNGGTTETTPLLK